MPSSKWWRLIMLHWLFWKKQVHYRQKTTDTNKTRQLIHGTGWVNTVYPFYGCNYSCIVIRKSVCHCHPTLIFAGKAGTRMELRQGAPLWLTPALTANIRLEWKGMAAENPLAYYDATTITSVNRFILLAQDFFQSLVLISWLKIAHA